MRESSGLFLGKCFCSLQRKKCETWLILPKSLFLPQDSSCLQNLLCGVNTDFRWASRHPARQRFLQKKGRRHRNTVTFMGASRLPKLASGWVRALNLRAQTKTTHSFSMVPWGLLLHGPREASAWTHQPAWGHLSSKALAQRGGLSYQGWLQPWESLGKTLHHTLMGWPSTGSVCWGQLPAVRGYRQRVPSPPSPDPGRLQQLITAINVYH